MRVHPSQINPNAQLDALYAAEKAAAKREAARTRKKLSEFASKLLGELDSGEACVVRLGADEESQEQGKRENQQKQGKRTGKPERGDARDADNSVSDWA
jgi:hypothetical protein